MQIKINFRLPKLILKDSKSPSQDLWDGLLNGKGYRYGIKTGYF